MVARRSPSCLDEAQQLLGRPQGNAFGAGVIPHGVGPNRRDRIIQGTTLVAVQCQVMRRGAGSIGGAVIEQEVVRIDDGRREPDQ